MRHSSFLLFFVAIGSAAPCSAQEVDLAPTPVAPTFVATASIAPPDGNVTPFYEAHPGTLLWLRDSDSRAAAAKLVDLLKVARLDGLPDGPALASVVQEALATGRPSDDQLISAAWVRYVQALNRPVTGVSFGDPALQLRPPSPDAVLARAMKAQSLAVHVDRISSVNPLYSALRNDATSLGQQSDPHVRATLERLRLIPASGRAILVDAANAELMMLQDGDVVDRMRVIVGKPDFATPLLAGTIWYVTFNPYWHIPADVAKRKVAPIVLERGISYLKAARYQTVVAFGGDKEEPVDPSTIDWKAVADGTAVAHIRQLSGPQNMMGRVKFGFVNDYGIFLHDTPHKDLFDKANRNLSLGCVRVEHPEALAKWLLGHDPVPLGDDSEENVQLTKGVPIYISYLTARPDGQTIAIASDIYKLDGGLGGTTVATSSEPAAK